MQNTRKTAASIMIPIMVAVGVLSISLVQRHSESAGLLPGPKSQQLLAPQIDKEAVALQWKKQSLEWEPAKTALDKARALFQQGQYTSAIAACQHAIELRTPYRSQATQLLGEIYLAQGRNEEALDKFTQAARNMTNIELDLGILLANFRLGKLDEVRRFDVQKWLAEHGLFALEELPETNTRKNLEANILLAHGVQADTTGQDAAALKNYSAAARIVPTNGLIAYFQARSLKRAGRKPEALHAYARAVTFGQGKIAKNAKSQIVMWPAAEQKEALQEAAKLKQP